MPAPVAAAAAPTATVAPVAAAANVPANMSIDSADENHITFSYDLPTYYNDDEIYRDIVNTISGMTAASTARPSSNNNYNNNNHDDDNDAMDVD